MSEAAPSFGIPVTDLPGPEANGTKPETPMFTCSTCGDTGAVRILFQSTTGLMPGKKGIACPDCKAGAVNIGAAGDARIANLEQALRLLRTVVILTCAGIVGLAILHAMKSEPFVKVDLKSAGGVKSE